MADLREKLEVVVVESFGLRFDPELAPKVEDGPPDLHEKLIRTRANLDRVEQLYADALKAQRDIREVLNNAKHNQEDAWNDAAVKGRQPEYSSAKEREANYSLASMEFKIKLRRAQSASNEVEFVVEHLRLMQRGLDGLRRDIELLVRAKSLSTSLER